MERTFGQRLEELWPEGSPRRAVVAVSGGADSTAMACLARSVLGKGLDYVLLSHFHHHLRGEEADRDAEFVRRLAAKLEIPFVRGDWDPEERRSNPHEDRNLQAAARKARYRFLVETARSRECPVLLTAHHAVDRVETILHNLARGGQSGAYFGIRHRIRRDGIWVLRPLLEVFPQTLKEYLASKGMDYREDSSNRDLKYRRNWIRNELLPHLVSAYPAFLERILERSGNALRETEETETVFARLRSKSLQRESSWVIPLKELADLDEEQRLVCLRWFLRDLLEKDSIGGWDPIRRAPLTELMESLVSGENRVVNLPNGIRAECRGGALSLSI